MRFEWLIRVHAPTSSGGLEVSPGRRAVSAHSELRGTSERGSLACLTRSGFGTSTANHTSEEGKKIKRLNHSARVSEKVKLAYFWVLCCHGDAAIFNSWPLSGPSPAAGSWVTESDLPAQEFSGKSVKKCFFFVTLLWVPGGSTSGPLFNHSDLKPPPPPPPPHILLPAPANYSPSC